jgi:hypothetical protein
MNISVFLANTFLALIGLFLITTHDMINIERARKIALWLGIIMVIPPLGRIFIEAILG